jgi:hypothetical protein
VNRKVIVSQVLMKAKIVDVMIMSMIIAGVKKKRIVVLKILVKKLLIYYMGLIKMLRSLIKM